MLKKTMTTVDFGGTERTEDYYFNLTRAEIMEMEDRKSTRLNSSHVKRSRMPSSA